MQNLTILTADEIRAAVRTELADFFASTSLTPAQQSDDELGGVELAHRVTGLAIPTIRTKAHLRQIPFSKPEGSKRLIFSRHELEEWMRSGKRKTTSEIAAEAENFQPKTTK